MNLEADLKQALHQRQREQLYRSRRVVASACGPELLVDGKPLLGFCANDYLGLANHPKVIEAYTAAAKRYGVGSGASHLVSGHSQLHHQLEEALADYTGRDRALVFSTGFMANLGLIQSLCDKRDAVLEDKLNHASLLDAGLHSGAKFSRYLHNDMANLAVKLAKTQARRTVVVSDAVFSMDGDTVAFEPLSALCEQYNASLMLDDAHGFGVLNGGRGFSRYSQQQLPIYMATLGKAVGVFGAFVAGSEALIETLIQYARSYIYTTALPPAVAAANIQALQLLQTEAWRCERLAQLVRRFRVGAAALNLQLMPSTTAIQPIVMGSAEAALQASRQLEAKGFWVAAIRPPTVPAGTSRLRITLSAAHTDAQLDSLLNALGEVCAA